MNTDDRTTGYMTVRKTDIVVGARRKADPKNGHLGYTGPQASITWDEKWLNICTDEYEGNASLNIEALPHLRRALTRVAREIASGRVKS